jgi:hypothetical protein
MSKILVKHMIVKAPAQEVIINLDNKMRISISPNRLENNVPSLEKTREAYRQDYDYQAIFIKEDGGYYDSFTVREFEELIGNLQSMVDYIKS